MSTPEPWPIDRPLRVGILLFEGVEPLDAIGPAQVLWSLGTARGLVDPFAPIEVHLVAETAEPIVAGHGLVIHPTTTYDEVGPLDVLIVPGGSGNDPDVVIPPTEPAAGRRYQVNHRPTLDFVATQAAAASITASVCTGTFILGAAGLLGGHRANTHWAARDELVAFMGARDEPFVLEVARVVDDGAVVSGGGVSSGIDLTLHVVERLLGRGCRDAAAAIIEHERRPARPFRNPRPDTVPTGGAGPVASVPWWATDPGRTGRLGGRRRRSSSRASRCAASMPRRRRARTGCASASSSSGASGGRRCDERASSSWLLLVDPERRDLAVELTRDLTLPGGSVHVAGAVGFVPSTAEIDVAEPLHPGRDRFVTFRMDSDDALLPGTIDAAARAAAAATDQTLIDLPRGYQVDLASMQLVETWYPTWRQGPFLAIVHHRRDEMFDTGGQHADARGDRPILRLDEPAWVQAIHGGNVSNRSNVEPASTRVVRAVRSATSGRARASWRNGRVLRPGAAARVLLRAGIEAGA